MIRAGVNYTLWVSAAVCVLVGIVLLGLAFHFQYFHDLGLNLGSNAFGIAAGLALVQGYLESRARRRRNAVLRWALSEALRDAYLYAKLIKRENQVSEERGRKVLAHLEPNLRKAARAITRKARLYQRYLDVDEYAALELIVDPLFSLGRGYIRSLETSIEPYVNDIILRVNKVIREMGDADMRRQFEILEFESPLRSESEGK